MSGESRAEPTRLQRALSSIAGRLLNVAAAPFFLVACLGVVIVVDDAWHILVTQDGSWIAEFPFGSKHMLEEGAWWYANPEVYAWTGILCGGCIAIAAWLVGRALLRRTWRSAVLALALFLAQEVIRDMGARFDWARRDHVLTSSCIDHCHGG